MTVQSHFFGNFEDLVEMANGQQCGEHGQQLRRIVDSSEQWVGLWTAVETAHRQQWVGSWTAMSKIMDSKSTEQDYGQELRRLMDSSD